MMLTQYFQQLACYIETGKELSKADFIKKIDRAVEIKISVRSMVHQTIFGFINKTEDGKVVLV
jgi:hypothetical protein